MTTRIRIDMTLRAGAFRCWVATALFWFAWPAAAYDWERHLWQDRLLFVVAPSVEDPAARTQLENLKRRDAAVRDRRLRIVEVYADSGRVDGEPLGSADVRDLRARLSLPADARALLLVGLDGGVKRRAPLDAELREIFVLIDGMPMRRAEIREKRASGLPVTEP